MKKKKNRKLNINWLNVGLLCGMGVILIFFIWSNVSNLQSSHEIVTEMNKVRQFYIDARENAVWGERIPETGERPATYGVYYDVARNELVMCADLAGDLACDENEVREKLELSNSFEITEFKVVNFIKFHKVNGACVDMDCQLDGDVSVLKIQSKSNKNINKNLILNQTDLKLRIE